MCVCVYIGELCEIVGFSEQLFSLSLPSHLRVSILTLVSLLSSSSTHVHTEKREKEKVAKKMAAGLHINREQSRVESSLQEDLEICSPICSPNPTATWSCICEASIRVFIHGSSPLSDRGCLKKFEEEKHVEIGRDLYIWCYYYYY